VKDTDIHENIEPIDLNQVLELLAEPYLRDGRITLEGRALAPYRASRWPCAAASAT
jgi:hypothetical protein